MFPGNFVSIYRSVFNTFIKADAKDSFTIGSVIFWPLKQFYISFGKEEFLFKISEFLATSVFSFSLLKIWGDLGFGSMIPLIVSDD